MNNSNKTRSLLYINPDLAKEWHPTKNPQASYNFFANSGKIAWWICNKGHEWPAIIKNRNKGSGCPYCSNFYACEDNCLETTHPDLAKDWHPTLNGSLTPKDIVAGSEKKVWWLCPKGHEYECIVYSRKEGHNCIYCTNQKVCLDNCLATVSPELAKEWHPTLNGSLTPYDVVRCSSKKVYWQCPIDPDHMWRTQVLNRSFGCGCPYCKKRSKGELRIKKYFDERKIKFKDEYRFKDCKDNRQLPFDFMVEINGQIRLIEFHGRQHEFPNTVFGLDAFEKLKKHDKMKEDYCKEHNIPLLVIWYRHYKNIEHLLNDFLK